MTRGKDTISEEFANLRDEMIRDKDREAVAENAGGKRKLCMVSPEFTEFAVKGQP